MSYVRVSDSSDSEDDANSGASATSTPSAQHRRVGSVAAASLASLTRTGNSQTYEYSSLGSVAAEEETQQERGVGENGQIQDESESDNDIEIHVRFGEGQDLSLRVLRTNTIAQVKEKVKEARPSIGEKYLRLIHSGKILSDNKTLIESLPKSLFTQIEVPHHHDLHSRFSSSVEAVEAAANNILAGISSRTSGGSGGVNNDNKGSLGMTTHTSLGSILPTHISYSTHPSSDVSTTSGTDSTFSHPLATGYQSNGNNTTTTNGHVSIPMATNPSSSSSTSNKNFTRTSSSTITIPVQTGPIYFLCSLSDFPPAQPPSEVKKGKAAAVDAPGTGSVSSRRVGTTRTSRSRRTAGPAGHIPAPSMNGVAGAAASSSLTLPGGSRNHGQSSSNQGNNGALPGVQEEGSDGEDEEENREGELSPVMTPQPTGFDRLREAGFSEDEIRSIRRQFHASRGTVTSTVGENGIAVGLDQDEDASAQARRVEEEWIDQHGAETLPEGLEGSYGEMVWGLMLGFFMGLVALFWFKEATFSRRQQMGIIAGLMINVGFGVLHLYY